MALTDVPVELSSTPSIVDGGNAAAITIDSSENVGIGTSSPSSTLEVAGSSNSTYLKIGGDDASNGRALTFTSSASASFNGAVHTINALSSQGVIAFATSSTERLRITSSGNVGIGVTSPQRVLTLSKSDSTGVQTQYTNSTTGVGLGDGFTVGIDGSENAEFWNYSNTNMLFANNGTERMRLDSSGKLLVGTTSGSGSSAPDNSSSASDAGVRISGDGYIGIGNNTNQSLYLNIIGADGAIADFRKNGTTVGYISTIGGDFVVGSTSGSDAALRMDGTNNQIYPSNATGSSRDNAISLGASNVRFKNLYLSGGINFGDASGGTSYSAGNAANLLDDYEEGSWTPTIAHNDGSGSIPLTVSEASYTKVGGLVYVRGYLTLVNPNGNAGTSSPYYGIRNFPFDPTNYGSWNLVYTSGNNASYGGYSSSASFYFLLPNSTSPHGTGHVSGTAFNAYGSNLTMMFDAVYRTNA